MAGKCAWKEEDLFDFVFGYLSKSKADELLLHLEDCERCQKKVIHWRKILADKQETLQPSLSLKKRIDKKVNQIARLKRKRLSSLPALAMAGSIVIVLTVIGLLQLQKGPADAYLVKQNEEIRENEIVNDPQTDQFNVIPVADFRGIKGNVWVNDATNEMLMKVDGLIPVARRDYQLWLVQENNELDGELLKVEDERILLYYKDPELSDVRFIQVSLEREGGSRQPTGPDTFYVDLKR